MEDRKENIDLTDVESEGIYSLLSIIIFMLF